MRVRIRDVVAPVFWPVHRAIARGTVQELVAKGGRGSGKSSYISIELVLQLLRHPACHAVVLRKIGGTLRTSVYAQIQWAIGALGLARQFRCTVSPMECTYLPTGQKILFFWHRRPRQAEKHQGAIWSHRPGLVRGAGPVRRPRGGAQCGAERVPRRQLYPGIQKLQPAGIGAQLGQPLCAGTAPRQAGAPLHLPRPAARLAGRTLFGGCRPPGTDQPHGVPP